jgi:pyruvate decarboxylase
MDAGYNDITEWKWSDIPAVFGASDKNVRKYQVKTKGDLEKILVNKEFNAPGQMLQFVEVHMDKKDAPKALVMTTEASAKVNAKET